MTKTVAVIGGGVVGLCAALVMHHQGFQVKVFDAGSLEVSQDEISARVYAINHASEHLLCSLAVWEKLEKSRISPYQFMHVWDANTGAFIDFDTRTIACNKLGSIIDEANLRHALLHVIANTNIELLAFTKVNSVHQVEEGIVIADGQQDWMVDFMLVADGALSPTRRLLDVPFTQWPYHQHALIAKVQIEKPHQRFAYQAFRKEGTLAFLPLADSNQCSIVWSCPPSYTEQLMQLPAEAFNQAITDAFTSKLGNVTLLSDRQHFPLHMRHVNQYFGSRWLILGDAAHTIHPLAGLGLNLGLSDVSALRSLFNNSDTPFSKKMLAQYQRQRKHAVWQTIALMEGIKALFLNPLSPVVQLRRFGLRLCNQLTPIKKLFIQHATGL